MEKVDAKKLEVAIEYLRRLSEGYNPVNNTPAEKDSVINDPNVIRCMFFVKEVLEELKRNDGYIGRRPRTNRDNTKQDYPLQALENYTYTGDKTITQFVEQLNELADMTKYKRIDYKVIRNWLIKKEYLDEGLDRTSGKNTTIPTIEGDAAGIYSKVKEGTRGTYNVVYYTQYAQRMIIGNMREIMKMGETTIRDVEEDKS